MPRTNNLVSPENPPPISYEAALLEMDTILNEIESNSAPLEELLKLTKRAEYLINYCQNKLRETESALS